MNTIEQIKKRWAHAKRVDAGTHWADVIPGTAIEDVKALLAEVERLRANSPENQDGSTDDAARYGTLDPAELTRHYVAGRGDARYAEDERHRAGLHTVYVEARKAAYRALLRQHGEGIERSEAERGGLEAEVERLTRELADQKAFAADCARADKDMGWELMRQRDEAKAERLLFEKALCDIVNDNEALSQGLKDYARRALAGRTVGV